MLLKSLDYELQMSVFRIETKEAIHLKTGCWLLPIEQHGYFKP